LWKRKTRPVKNIVEEKGKAMSSWCNLDGGREREGKLAMSSWYIVEEEGKEY
jgi:hypothetical protein